VGDVPDAVVIGSGPNGLVAANRLVDAGWDVVVLEAQPEPGGAVRSAELTLPGWTHDVFSAFYPLGVSAPAIRDLGLERFGLQWSHAPKVLAHPFEDGRCAVLTRDVDETAASVEQFAPGDGDAWRGLVDEWHLYGAQVLDVLFRPFPPIVPLAKLVGRLRSPRAMLDVARFSLLPVRRMGEERFSGDGGPALLSGNMLHTDLTPDSTLGGFFGWLLCMLGQTHGFPVPVGGAGQLTRAMVDRFVAGGGVIECAAPVVDIVVRDGAAVAVRTADGREIDARRAVLADVVAPHLYRDLVGEAHLPSRVVEEIRRFDFDDATVKIDWALDGPVPWASPDVHGAGTVHLGDDIGRLTAFSSQLKSGLIPDRPFLVFGQMTTSDPTRSPAGTETAWGYTHVPFHVRGDAGGSLTGKWTADEADAFAARVEAEVERFAPGFRERIVGRHVHTPPTMEAANANLVHGAVNQGTSQLHQQLVFRPIPGLGRPSTPIKRLYLAGASAHPGGGVHGACGANAARVALRRDRLRLGS
jgi:phytoene dehydrogenase-like protein